MKRPFKYPICQMLALAVTLLMAIGGVSTASTQSLDHERLRVVADSAANAHVAGQNTPGLSVAVARGGEIIFTQGYGTAVLEMEVAASPETVYMIGSITKQITAATIMRLVEAGEMSLYDSITDYLPDYPTHGHDVTIRHLLNHTSGIKGFRVLHEENRQRFRLDLSYEEMVDLFGTQPFDFGPGERYEYNNMAYYLLGEIIGRVTGMAWHEYMERELFGRLGLEDMFYCSHSRIIPNRAEGYEQEDGELVNARYLSMEVGGAAGALCSTVGDLILWTRLLYEGQVVSTESLQEMTTPGVLTSGDTIPYGYGLQLGGFFGRRAVFHGGRANGFTGGLIYFPEEDLTIAVLTNSGEAAPHLVALALAQVSFDE